MTATLTRRALPRVPVATDSDLWVEADGRGGYAALRRDGGPPARPEEGAFAAAVGPQRLPHVLVATLGELLDGAALGRAGSQVDHGVLLQQFLPWPGRAGVQREVLLPHGRAALLVRYTLLHAESAVLTLEPRLPFRAAAALTRANAERNVATTELGGAFWLRPYPALPALRIAADAPVQFRLTPYWEHAVSFEAAGTSEDQHVPGCFTHTLRQGAPVTFEFALAGEASADPGAAFHDERRRRRTRPLRTAALERILARDPLGAPFLTPGAAADVTLLPALAAADVPRAALVEALAGATPGVAAVWAALALDAPAGQPAGDISPSDAAWSVLDAAVEGGSPLEWALATDLAGRLADRTAEPAALRRLGRLRRAAAARFRESTPEPHVTAFAAGLRHSPLDGAAWWAARRAAARWADPELRAAPARPEALASAVAVALAVAPPTRGRLAAIRTALAHHAREAVTAADPRAAVAWLVADTLLSEAPR